MVIYRLKAGGKMAEEKTKKTVRRKAKNDPKANLKPVSAEDTADAEVERFFDVLEEQYKDVPPAELERGAKKIQAILEGNINWTEVLNFTPEMIFQMAEYGFTQFKVGRYADAERVFKILTIIDRTNAYYHSVMGSILQRQRRFGDAIAEYTQAIEIDPNDIVSLTNRGEVYMRYGLVDEARADFEKAIGLDPKGEDRFANRSRILLDQLDKGGKKVKKDG